LLLSLVVAMPMLKWTETSSCPARTGCSNDFMIRSATEIAPRYARSRLSTITANSSPPSRAIASDGRTDWRSRSAIPTRSSSPAT
jgi:hypothetical protein